MLNSKKTEFSEDIEELYRKIVTPEQLIEIEINKSIEKYKGRIRDKAYYEANKDKLKAYWKARYLKKKNEQI